ncbi:nucleotidyltransferase family protein [Parabacteroides bouchesdurhonensis]|uniref:nucleotidyltransferase family protein n=1 Tax=Parabacteroides bouchesdurhonensis TaxID=1936995 RepID=UPI000C833E29|nr:nucleotidyltransferase family protein [Parabacteroides bouchesdurhonensis]
MKTTSEYISILKDYMQQNADKYGISRMGIFGSVARGEQKEESDVDIFYEASIIPPLSTVGQIQNDLERLLERPVDLVRIREKMNKLLLKEIQNDGIAIQ